MTLKSSKRNFLVLVKILLDETSRNQIELAEAQCGAGGGGGGGGTEVVLWRRMFRRLFKFLLWAC